MSQNANATWRKAIAAAIDSLASYRLAVVLLALLLILTFLGTLEQGKIGLYATQKKYFESIILVHRIRDVVPIPLPGAYPVMTLLFINLLCGGIVRARKNWRYPGMLIAHFGILIMLAGGFITFKLSINGSMLLYENDRSDSFQSYYDWVVEIAPAFDGEGSDLYLVPTSDFSGRHGTHSWSYTVPDLPFTVTFSDFYTNCQPRRAATGSPGRAIDGFYLEPLPPAAEAEQNVHGAYVTIRDNTTGTSSDGILWGLALHPLVVEAGQQLWTLKLRREQWRLPFAIVLDDFTMEQHPGTAIAKLFHSKITKIEGAVQEKIDISMNEPLRYKGYTFFQSSWGPQNARPGEALFSVFSVVRNPADQWPLYACIIVGIGLLIHFSQRLYFYLLKQNSPCAGGTVEKL